MRSRIQQKRMSTALFYSLVGNAGGTRIVCLNRRCCLIVAHFD
jgi:hypothetical protein